MVTKNIQIYCFLEKPWKSSGVPNFIGFLGGPNSIWEAKSIEIRSSKLKSNSGEEIDTYKNNWIASGTYLLTGRELPGWRNSTSAQHAFWVLIPPGPLALCSLGTRTSGEGIPPSCYALLGAYPARTHNILTRRRNSTLTRLPFGCLSRQDPWPLYQSAQGSMAKESHLPDAPFWVLIPPGPNSLETQRSPVLPSCSTNLALGRNRSQAWRAKSLTVGF